MSVLINFPFRSIILFTSVHVKYFRLVGHTRNPVQPRRKRSHNFLKIKSYFNTFNYFIVSFQGLFYGFDKFRHYFTPSNFDSLFS